MGKVRVGVQAEPRDLASWLDLARRLDAGPFDSLLLGDHPGSGASPWPALGAAATVTGRLRLGTYVSQAGIRDPVQLASDAASLDVLAPGRVRLGLGAGHTPSEWKMLGRERPSAHDRAARLEETAVVLGGLLAGDTVTLEGAHITVRGARLTDLGAFAGRVSLTVGGASRSVLRTAARHADVVAMSGLGRTLPDGHRHEVRWSRERFESDLALVREEADAAGTVPSVEVLVQRVVLTEDRDRGLADFAAAIGQRPDPADLSAAPYLLIGTVTEMTEQLRRQSHEWDLAAYVVREDAVPVVQRVLSALGGH